MRVLEHHTQTKPRDDWGNKEHESEVEVEAIEGDLEQAQLGWLRIRTRKLVCAKTSYELDSNATKPSKLKFSGQEVQKAQHVITPIAKKNF